MSSTNKTPNLKLSQFLSTDRPSWQGDVNGDMNIIDQFAGNTVKEMNDAHIAINEVKQGLGALDARVTTAEGNITTAQTTADNALTEAATAHSIADNALTQANNASNKADSATTSAETAQSAAEAADAKAVAAQTAANNAQTTANKGVSDAAAAQTTADQATTVANNASTKLNNLVAKNGSTAYSPLNVPAGVSASGSAYITVNQTGFQVYGYITNTGAITSPVTILTGSVPSLSITEEISVTFYTVSIPANSSSGNSRAVRLNVKIDANKRVIIRLDDDLPQGQYININVGQFLSWSV